MKKVLFLIQWYPPILSANGVCDSNVISELKKYKDVGVTCLTYRLFGEKHEDTIENVRVIRFVRSIWWNCVIYAKMHASKKMSQLILILDKAILRIIQMIAMPLYPITHPLVCLKYIIKAKHLMKCEKFDMVISEYNGFDTLLAGYYLKKKNPQLKYIQVFWDSLSGGFSAKYLPKTYTLKKKKRIEREVLANADAVIVMETHMNHLCKTWAGSEYLKKIYPLNVPYFVPHDVIPDKEAFDPECINIVFAGNMINRNIVYFLKTLSMISKYRCKLYIYTSASNHGTIRNQALSFENMVSVNAYLPHDQIIRVLAGADFLVNFGVNNPAAISGKIFEYISLGKPIISTYNIDNEACLPYLRKYPAAYLIDERLDDPKEEARQLTTFFDKYYGYKIDGSSLRSVFYKNSPTSYAEFIYGYLGDLR